ncbi:MAG: S41 family peptidase [Selenomonadaceae bacterium]|nr:S41 family peptidase [Selenomonadaceae bacterium]
MSKKKLFFIIFLTAFVSFLSTLFLLGFALAKADVKLDDAARFIGTYKIIKSRYITETDSAKLFDGAISGMVKSLDDPHSLYMEPRMYNELLNQTVGSFGGIGVYMGFKDKKVTVVSVIDGTPAKNAGVMVNDEILAVDDVPITEIEPEEVVFKIRGEVGSSVKLKLKSQDGKKKELIIVRDNIKVKSVQGKMLKDSVAYIRISNFNEHTAEEFGEVYKQMENEGMKKTILDLRQNPGGLVNTCVEVANYLVPKGKIVTVENREGKIEEYDSTLEKVKYPLAVLVDGNSASASEIIAGAIKDTNAGTLVGVKTYGKGSIQVVLPLMHSDAVKLTVAKYFTPNGESIDGVGIEPDVEIKLTPADTEDTQLNKAVEVLKEK